MAKKVYVKVEDCEDKYVRTGKRIDKIELALFGSDGRAGMAGDIRDIKTKLEVATGAFRSLVIPIIVPLVLALIGYALGKYAA